MQLLQTLESEHCRIDAVTRALEVFAQRLDQAPDNVHELMRFTTFLRGYVDGYHHDCEETVLLPALVAAGFNPEVGPVAHIRDQHREEATLLLRFEMAASTRMPWDAAKVRAIADAAVAFVVFSREHMRKEHSLLFPVAEKDLEPKAAELDVVLRRFESRRAPRWNVPWLEQLGEELAASHGTATSGSIRSTLALP